ncbi:zinc-finger domain-containing protein [Roseomonas sp. NAR14]|uniref:Zinc-finger domain-containing protein n=1 Tax=Roseomonas acroporae TaxID=2937791 RepID=A0A9X2BWC6_9PROT|nr:zinc-finger domain-containing protein [Roseomonas acroporae]MCK8787542.1 zinc-finger domain-containing protein [Roseomonas acroporae]
MQDGTQTGYTPIPVPGVTPEDVIMVEHRAVPCDGGGGALGHPRIWLRIVDREICCPYCSRTFRLREGFGDDGGH